MAKRLELLIAETVPSFRANALNSFAVVVALC